MAKKDEEATEAEIVTDDTSEEPKVDAVDDKENANPRPETPVKDSQGRETSPASEEYGAGQVQAALDAAEKQGFWDGSTDPEAVSPPDNSHTVAGVTGNTVLQDLVDAEKSDDK